MDGPTDYRTKWSKSGRERQIQDIAYTWNLKIYINEFIYKTKIPTNTENKLTVMKGKRRDKLED